MKRIFAHPLPLSTLDHNPGRESALTFGDRGVRRLMSAAMQFMEGAEVRRFCSLPGRRPALRLRASIVNRKS